MVRAFVRVLWTKLTYLHSQTSYQRLLLTPVAVRCVENLGLSNPSDGKELAIRRIKLIRRKLLESAVFIVAGRNRNHAHTNPSMSVITYMLEERVAHSRGPRETQPAFVFVENEVLVVDNYSLFAANSLQLFDTS